MKFHRLDEANNNTEKFPCGKNEKSGNVQGLISKNIFKTRHGKN